MKSSALVLQVKAMAERVAILDTLIHNTKTATGNLTEQGEILYQTMIKVGLTHNQIAGLYGVKPKYLKPKEKVGE